METKRRILVIDDEEIIGIAIGIFLKTNLLDDWVVETATTLESGLRMAPGAFIIMLDLRLSNDWTELTTPTRIAELSQHAPVIVVTGYSDGQKTLVSTFINDLIEKYGADNVVLKDQAFGSKVVTDMLMMATAAVGRRLYQKRIANFTEKA